MLSNSYSSKRVTWSTSMASSWFPLDASAKSTKSISTSSWSATMSTSGWKSTWLFSAPGTSSFPKMEGEYSPPSGSAPSANWAVGSCRKAGPGCLPRKRGYREIEDSCAADSRPSSITLTSGRWLSCSLRYVECFETSRDGSRCFLNQSMYLSTHFLKCTRLRKLSLSQVPQPGVLPCCLIHSAGTFLMSPKDLAGMIFGLLWLASSSNVCGSGCKSSFGLLESNSKSMDGHKRRSNSNGWIHFILLAVKTISSPSTLRQQTSPKELKSGRR